MDGVVDVDNLVDTLIDREGGFVNNPADKGGPTCFGITEAVARPRLFGADAIAAEERGRRNLPAPVLATPVL